MSLLRVDKLTIQRGKKPILSDVTFKIAPGECVGLIGPNGAGKTTLMRAILGFLPHSGTSSLTKMSPADRAKACAWLPQSREIAWPITVDTLIALGRIPHLPRGNPLNASDQSAVDNAITRMGLDDYRNRIATQLSGGEQARVLIARTLAQDTPLLMADEPIAGLDPANQIATMQVFADLANQGRAVLASLHDLGLAARHCTRLILVGDGRLIADGVPEDVLTTENLAHIFGVTAHFELTARGPIFQPLDIVA